MPPAEPPHHKDSRAVGADGIAYISRVVPIPCTVSAQAQASLARHSSDVDTHASIAQQRQTVDIWQAGSAEAFRAIYPVNLEAAAIAGVPVRIVRRQTSRPATVAVLMNVHVADSSSTLAR